MSVPGSNVSWQFFFSTSHFVAQIPWNIGYEFLQNSREPRVSHRTFNRGSRRRMIDVQLRMNFCCFCFEPARRTSVGRSIFADVPALFCEFIPAGGQWAHCSSVLSAGSIRKCHFLSWHLNFTTHVRANSRGRRRCHANEVIQFVIEEKPLVMKTPSGWRSESGCAGH